MGEYKFLSAEDVSATKVKAEIYLAKRHKHMGELDKMFDFASLIQTGECHMENGYRVILSNDNIYLVSPAKEKRSHVFGSVSQFLAYSLATFC